MAKCILKHMLKVVLYSSKRGIIETLEDLPRLSVETMDNLYHTRRSYDQKIICEVCVLIICGVYVLMI